MTRDIHAASKRDRKKARQSRAWLDGVEVTSDCYYADDRLGMVRLLCRNETGHAYLDLRTGRAARCERRGVVVIRRVTR